MLDDEIYFTCGEVLGGTPLKVGDTVNGIAVRSSGEGGWKALRVRIGLSQLLQNCQVIVIIEFEIIAIIFCIIDIMDCMLKNGGNGTSTSLKHETMCACRPAISSINVMCTVYLPCPTFL